MNDDLVFRDATAVRAMEDVKSLRPTDLTEYALPHPDSGPSDITAAPDGNLWFCELKGNRIGRMVAQTGAISESPLPHQNSAPRVIAVGADGNVWFTEY